MSKVVVHPHTATNCAACEDTARYYDDLAQKSGLVPHLAKLVDGYRETAALARAGQFCRANPDRPKNQF